MAEQPETMEQLVQSVVDAARAANKTPLLLTIATRRYPDLSSAGRAALATYENAVIAEGSGLQGALPGASITVAQTDEYYRRNDINGTFAQLVAHAAYVGRRTR